METDPIEALAAKSFVMPIQSVFERSFGQGGYPEDYSIRVQPCLKRSCVLQLWIERSRHCVVLKNSLCTPSPSTLILTPAAGYKCSFRSGYRSNFFKAIMHFKHLYQIASGASDF